MDRSTSALIIASGKTPLKDGFSPQMQVGTISAVERIILVFKRVGIERIVVVCPNENAAVEKLTAKMNVVYLHSHKDSEMLECIKLGLRYLKGKCDRTFITHSDIPLFSVETVKALLSADEAVCVPSCEGRTGHPLLLDKDCFSSVLSCQSDDGLQGVLSALGLPRQIVEVADQGVIMNIQSDDNFEELINDHSLNAVHPEIQIKLSKEKPFYGSGSHHLLELTKETASLREACRRMGISYTKGRGIIAVIEEQTGISIIESRQGGKTGGQSVVTESGEKLISSYNSFCYEARAAVEEIFSRHFEL